MATVINGCQVIRSLLDIVVNIILKSHLFQLYQEKNVNGIYIKNLSWGLPLGSGVQWSSFKHLTFAIKYLPYVFSVLRAEEGQ